MLNYIYNVIVLKVHAHTHTQKKKCYLFSYLLRTFSVEQNLRACQLARLHLKSITSAFGTLSAYR